MKYYLTLPILLLFLLQSCNEENVPLNHLQFYWEQTGCADPWSSKVSNSSNEAVVKAVEDYLRDEGVLDARVVSVTSDGVQQVCLACSCTTGRRINVTAPRNQKNKLLALGFQEYN